MKRKLTIILALVMLASCGGGIHTANSIPWGNASVSSNAFNFASDYPADIVIPDIDGMRGTAFVVSLFSPGGVVAIDLDSNPLSVSSEFKGVEAPDGTGWLNSVYIMSATRAFLLSSSHIIDFNPTTGSINESVALGEVLNLDESMPISTAFDADGDGSADTEVSSINLNTPAGLAVSNNKLYVTMSNYLNYFAPPVAAPGVVLIFDIDEGGITKSDDYIVTTDFIPSGVTALPDGTVAVTNSGVSDIVDGASQPVTNSSVDFIDPEKDEIANNVSFGSVSLSFKDMAVTSGGTRAYIGSATYGEVYSIDLTTYEAINTHENPITISGNNAGSDFLPALALTVDDRYLFVASYDNSAIYPADVSTAIPQILPEAFPSRFQIGYPKGVTEENPTGINTGVGDIAVRPGTPGTDFTGPDLFALTGSPGTVVAVRTYEVEVEVEVEDE